MHVLLFGVDIWKLNISKFDIQVHVQTAHIIVTDPFICHGKSNPIDKFKKHASRSEVINPFNTQ